MNLGGLCGPPTEQNMVKVKLGDMAKSPVGVLAESPAKVTAVGHHVLVMEGNEISGYSRLPAFEPLQLILSRAETSC